MNKAEFGKVIQEEWKKEMGDSISLPQAKRVINVFITSLKRILLNGNNIRFRSFGRFEFKKREGFKRRTFIKGGKKVEGGFITEVEDHVVAYFNPSNKFNERLTERLKPLLFEEAEE